MATDNSNSNVPLGWDNRQNQISEHDLKLGAAAANKFASQTNSNAYFAENEDGASDSVTPTYKTSDEVRAFYLKKIEGEQAKSEGDGNARPQKKEQESNLPIGWGDRQKAKSLEAAQMGAFSKTEQPPTAAKLAPAITLTKIHQPAPSSSKGGNSAEKALVHVATHTLDRMAEVLEQNPTTPLSNQERAAFAAAMQRAMLAIAKCKE